MHPRLFLAIRPPSPIRDGLLAMMQGVVGARWQNEAQLHLTLVYLGETEPHLAETLATELAALTFTPFEIALRGLGQFEKRGSAHTLWAGVEPSEPLSALQSRIARLCRHIGLAPERRKYHPHITLARLNAATGPLAPFCARHLGRDLGSWRCESYTLYESHLRPEGSLYEAVRVYRTAE